MQTMTTNEALEYIGEQTGRRKPPHKQQLNRWMRQNRITPHIYGMGGAQHIFTVYDLDELVKSIRERDTKRNS